MLRRVSTLAMLYRLDRDARYVTRAWTELEAASRFPDWNPRHFLDTAEMTHAFAIGYDWLYEAWTPEQKAVLRRALLDKGLRPALACYWGQSSNSWWVDDKANWNQVCNGGIGLGALALGTETPQEAGEILQAILWSLPPSLRRLGPDGGTSEGPSYWDYGLSYVTILLAGMDSALGSDFGLSQTPGLAQAGFFPIYLKGPSGAAFNFSDGGEAAWGIPGMFWLSHKFQQPAFATHRLQYLRTPTARPSALDLWWGTLPIASSLPESITPVAPAVPTEKNPSEKQVDALANLPLVAYFRNTEVFTWRGAWNDPNALFFGLRAGNNTASHSHLDLGSFVFEAQGQRWTIDLGREDYNLPGYFGELRTSYYRTRAEGHNTLVLNPGVGADQSPAMARIIRQDIKPVAKSVTEKSTLERNSLTSQPIATEPIPSRLKPHEAFAIADLTPAYATSTISVQRGIAHINPGIDPGYVLVQDEIKAPRPVDTWWFMHTRATIELSQDKTSAFLKQGGKQLTVQIVAPRGAQFTIQKAEPLLSSPHLAKQDGNNGIRKLSIHLPAIKEESIAVILAPSATAQGTNLPVGDAQTLPAEPQVLTPLTRWDIG